MKVLIRGGGDLASGIALRLFKSRFQVLITEISRPRVVRRSVSFANAVYEEKNMVEDVSGILIRSPQAIFDFDFVSAIPVLVDPDAMVQSVFKPNVIVDARMLKKEVPYKLQAEPLVLGLGPGFSGGMNCHAAIETNRGHFLGRVLWNQSAQEDTAMPGRVQGKQNERVLRAPISGEIQSDRMLGQLFTKGEVIARVNGEPVLAPFDGCLRGLMFNGLFVEAGEKIGDLDPRLDPVYTRFVSEKSLAIAGGVLEAIMTYFHPIP